MQNFARFSLVSLSIHPRSLQERIGQGEGRWSRPAKTTLERSDLTEKFQFRESHTEAETKKVLTKIPVPSKKKKHHIYIQGATPAAWTAAGRSAG